MNTSHRIIILFRRKNAGVCKNKQYHSGKNYTNNKVMLISEPYLKVWLNIIFSFVQYHVSEWYHVYECLHPQDLQVFSPAPFIGVGVYFHLISIAFYLNRYVCIFNLF